MMIACRCIRVVGGALLTVGLAACQFLPGTSAYDQEKAKRAAAAKLLDPASAQFRNVRSVNGAVCGELNGKNKMGAFVGFSRFLVRTASQDVLIDPGFEFSDLLDA